VSVKVPPPGTRGSRFPKFPSFMARFFSGRQRQSFRRSGGGRTQGGIATLLLETVGARSGEPRSAMLGFLEDGPGAWLVVASLAGSARNPGWLHNLAKNPTATVELADGRRVPVTATSLVGPELDAAWKRVKNEAPEYANYLSVTDRAMPIVRLRELEATQNH
jgi:deazaflavin-dependent oxidoreductase (nitroreductase family)